MRVDESRLNDGDPTFRVDRENAVHSRQLDQDTAFDGRRSARKTRTGSARREGDAFISADADDGLDVFRRRGEDHGERARAKVRQRVAFVDEKLRRSGKAGVLREDGAETVEDVHGVSVTSIHFLRLNQNQKPMPIAAMTARQM